MFEDGKFKLFDNNSKFGTLVEVREPLDIGLSKLVLQSGRTVIILQLIVKEFFNKFSESMQIEIDSMSGDLHHNNDSKNRKIETIKLENVSSSARDVVNFNEAINLNLKIDANISRNKLNEQIILEQKIEQEQINYQSVEDRFEIQSREEKKEENGDNDDDDSESNIDFKDGEKSISLIEASRKIKKTKKQSSQKK